MIEAVAILLAIISGIAVSVHYRIQSKKYKKLFEEELKKHLPNTKPHMSDKAIKTRMDLQHWLEVRSQILLRDNFRCKECNFYKHLEVHHIVPKSKGGSDDPSNLVTLCQRCHAKKHGFGHRENRRKRHTRRNRRKKFKRYLKENARQIRTLDYPVQSFEDVHPFREDLSDESVVKREDNYKKWENNELNQPT